MATIPQPTHPNCIANKTKPKRTTRNSTTQTISNNKVNTIKATKLQTLSNQNNHIINPVKQIKPTKSITNKHYNTTKQIKLAHHTKPKRSELRPSLNKTTSNNNTENLQKSTTETTPAQIATNPIKQRQNQETQRKAVNKQYKS